MNENGSSIKFLGTAGARIVMSKQLRASGGAWLTVDGTHMHLDPGPGALVRCIASRPKLDPSALSAIINSHRHLDHSNDVNAMMEAMTSGGNEKRGTVFATSDALGDDPVIFKYVRKYVERIELLEEKKSYSLNGITFETPMLHKHQVETYGFKFSNREGKHLISWITDTRFFDALIPAYAGCGTLVMHVVFLERRDYDHLCVEDAQRLIQEIKPERAVLTHFGMTMLKAKPWEIAKRLEDQTQIKVIAASDGMTLKFQEKDGKEKL